MRPMRILEIRRASRSAAGLVAGSLTERLATDEDGGVVAFIGRTRVDAGDARAGPGGRGRAPRRPRASTASSTRPSSRWPSRCSARSRTRSRRASASGGSRSSTAPGAVPLGDASVVIVAVAPHRDAAFDAARYAIDETKARAPIWKAERFTDGHVWIGARRADRTGGAGDRLSGRPPDRAVRAGRGGAAILRAMQLLARRHGPRGPARARRPARVGLGCGRGDRRRRVGQERAILRLFGVTGLDRAGRPLAAEVVDRYVGPDPRRLGGGIALPFAMAMAEYDLAPQELALEVAAGDVDLGPRGGAARRARPAGDRARRRVRAVAGRDGADRREPDGAARAARGPRRPAAAVDRHGASASPAIVDALDEARRRSTAGRSSSGSTCRPSRELAERTGPGRPAPVERLAGAALVARRARRARSRGPADPHRRPARARGPAPVRRRGGRAPSRLRPDHDRRPGPRRARPGRRRRLRADRHRHRRPDARDRHGPRRPRPRARRPRLRPPAPGSRRHAHPRPGRAADRRAATCRRGVPSDPPLAPAGRSRCSCSPSRLARRDGLPDDAVVVGGVPGLARRRVRCAGARRRRGRPAPRAASRPPASRSSSRRCAGTWRRRGTRSWPRCCRTRATCSRSCAGRGLRASRRRQSRGATSVAASLRASRETPVLRGSALDHATRAVAAAAATLRSLDEGGWAHARRRDAGLCLRTARRRGRRRAHRGVRSAGVLSDPRGGADASGSSSSTRRPQVGQFQRASSGVPQTLVPERLARPPRRTPQSASRWSAPGQLAAIGGERVLHAERAAAIGRGDEDPGALEAAQPVREDVGRDPRDRLAELVEAPRARQQRLDDQQAPAVADPVERDAEGAGGRWGAVRGVAGRCSSRQW